MKTIGLTSVLVMSAVLLSCGLPAAAQDAAPPATQPAGASSGPATDPANVYKAFNDFCKGRFGGKHEALVYETFGQELKLDEKATWSYVSETSATLAFATNIPAVSYIEYFSAAEGADAKAKPPGKTEPTERAFYTHIHRLSGLTTGVAYDYSFVAVDEKGNKSILHKGRITPAKIANAIHIPGDIQGAPYNLTKGNSTYVLTQDITADSTAINIMAGGVTLDLNGHTITYDNAKDAPLGAEKGFGHFGEQGPHGVRSSYAGKDAKVLNGVIIQGKGQRGDGSEPLYRAGEVAGLSVYYSGTQVSGMNEVSSTHHCQFQDSGTEMTNRHAGTVAIRGDKAHNNLIKRARHRGMTGSSKGEYNNNEIYVDSYATNAFGIMFYAQAGASATGNKVFGTGYHPIGIGAVSKGVKDIKVTGNFIHLEAVKPVARSKEYGDQSEVECVRVTWGGENIEYAGNVMIAKAEEGGEASGIWHFSQPADQKDVVYRNNIIKVLRLDDRPTDKLEGAIRICGSGKDGLKNQPVLLENNKVISNFCNVRLGDGYGVGSNAQFVGNTFVKVGEQKSYATIICGHAEWASAGHVFKDTKFEGGAGFDKVQWQGTGEREFTVVDTDGNKKVYKP